MKTGAKIFLWYLAFLAVGFIAALALVGPETALRYAEKVNPWAVVYRNRPETVHDEAGRRDLILFLGDSSVARPPWAGKDAPHIPELLEAELAAGGSAGVQVVDWTFPAATFFDYQCLLFEAERYSPSLLIISINWRNLGPCSWERGDSPAFHEVAGMVRPAPEERPGFSAAARPATRLAGVLREPALYLTGLRMGARTKMGLEPEKHPLEDRVDELPPAEQLMAGLSDARLFGNYATRVEPEQLQALMRLAAAAERRGVRLLFYLTPIHFEELTARSAFDAAAFGRSVAEVAGSLSTGSSFCVDLVGLLEEHEFIDTAEHYTSEGNRTIARALAPVVAEALERTREQRRIKELPKNPSLSRWAETNSTRPKGWLAPH